MSYRSKFGQFGLKIQTAEGTAESLSAGDYTTSVADVEVDYDVRRAERNNERPTFTNLASVPAARSISIRGTIELAGGSATTIPLAGRMLQAQCFAYAVAKMITLTSVTNGPFKTGQAIGNNTVQGSATKTGTVLHFEDTGGGGGKLWYLAGTGAFINTDTVYAYPASGSQPTGTASAAPANKGHVFKPLDPNGATESDGLTIDRRKGDESHTAIDFRADGGLMFESGQFAKLSFDGKGVPVLDVTDAANPKPAQPSPAFVAGVAALPEPDPCRGMFCTVGGSTFVITKAELKFGATVAERPSISGETLASGMVAPRHTGRKPQWTLDPERVRGAGSADFQSKIFTTSGVEVIVSIGATGGANGLWKVYTPTCQTSERKDGDREGLMIDDVTLDCVNTTAAGEMLICNLWA